MVFLCPPDAVEADLASDFLKTGSLEQFCLALLNTNEAIYID